MESPFQVSPILYLDSTEHVPRGEKERLSPSIRSGKGAGSSSSGDRLALLQRTSVNTQDASRPQSLPGRPLEGRGTPALGRELQEEASHRVRVRPPRQCKVVPLPTSGMRPWVSSPFENMIQVASSSLKNTHVYTLHQKSEGIQGPHVSHPQALNPALQRQDFSAEGLAFVHMLLPGRLP